MKYVGLNMDGNLLNEEYCQRFRTVNANHLRLMWSGFDRSPTAFVQLKNTLDLCSQYGIWVTPSLGVGWVRGVYADVETAKTDFLAVFNEVGDHPAILNWELSNEPNFVTQPTAKAWCHELADYIRTLDSRDVYVGLTTLFESTKPQMLLDCQEFSDICAFHYYVAQPGTVGDTFWDETTVVNAILNGTPLHYGQNLRQFSYIMSIVRAANVNHLPVWLDEFGMPTRSEPYSGRAAYTTVEGQKAYYETLFAEIGKYPEIQGLNLWHGPIQNRYSLWYASHCSNPSYTSQSTCETNAGTWNVEQDGTEKPAAKVVADYYKSVNSGNALWLILALAAVGVGISSS